MLQLNLKNHKKIGIKCEWIMEVKETAGGA